MGQDIDITGQPLYVNKYTGDPSDLGKIYEVQNMEASKMLAAALLAVNPVWSLPENKTPKHEFRLSWLTHLHRCWSNRSMSLGIDPSEIPDYTFYEVALGWSEDLIAMSPPLRSSTKGNGSGEYGKRLKDAVRVFKWLTGGEFARTREPDVPPGRVEHAGPDKTSCTRPPRML